LWNYSMKIAFLVQNLAHVSDSVGYDCIFQYNVLKEIYPDSGDVRIFSVVFDRAIHENIDIEPFSDFFSFIEENPEAHVIYHFCDGWDKIDSFLRDNVKNAIIRWHNNTPPWFYVDSNIDFAAGCTQGFEIIADLARSGKVRFMVNSEFTRRQLHALDGLDSSIETVFPASSFLLKDRTVNDGAISLRQADGPIELLFVSRVVPHKGHRHILSIAAAVQRFSGRRVKVTFAGALEERLANYWTDLQAIAIRLNVEAVFPGLVSADTLERLYRSCDAFLCMSEHEGFGMPVFEAMRSRVPVIAWASSAMVDLLADHPFADADFQIHRFAACVLAALEPGIRQRVIDYQDYVLAQYTYDSVRNQLLDAMVRASGQTIGTRSRDMWPEPESVRDIVDFVGKLSAWIEEDLGSDVETFMHDAAINYMGLYDIAAHKRLISLLRNDQQAADSSGFRTSGDLDELHAGNALIHRIMAGGDGEDAIEHLNDLLAFDDEVFIRLSFQTLLGRNPDTGALSAYLRQLRRGTDKSAIIRDLAQSQEARAHGRKLSGLDGKADIIDPLTRIESGVARIKRYLVPSSGGLPAYHPMGSIHHVDDLLSLNDAAFVDMAYRLILGRAADADGMEYYVNALRNGLSRRQFLSKIVHDENASGTADNIDGLSAYIHEAHDAAIDDPSKRLARIGNELGQLTNLLVVRDDSSSSAAGNVTSGTGTLLRLAEKAVQGTGRADGSRLEHMLSKAAVNPAQILDSREDYNICAQPGELEFEYLHQIFITNNGQVPTDMPVMVRHNVDSFRRLHPEAQYRLWGMDDLRHFIAENFEQTVLQAFDMLQAFALKADLGRYCVLYVYGGIYSDLSNRFLSRWRIGADKLIGCFREHKPLHGALWMNQNTIIYAAARQPEIKLAIDLVVENVRNRDYGVSSLAPSGPVLFGRAIAVIGRAGQYQIGDSVNVQVEGALNRSTYVDVDGALVATRLQGQGGKPSEIGLRGTNVYGEMWDRREIYGEGVMFFAHDNQAISTRSQRSAEGVHLDRGAELALAPFALPKGLYAVTWRFNAGASACDFKVLTHDRDGRPLSRAERLVPDAVGQADHVMAIADAMDVRLSLQLGKTSAAIFKAVVIRRLSSDPHGQIVIQTAAETPILADAKRRIESISHVHHILYPAATQLSDAEEAEMAENMRMSAALHPEATQRIWSEATLRDFIAENFAADVVAVYDRLPFHINRSELGRYCLLYALGGIYVDPWLRMVNPIDVPDGKAMALFRTADVEQGASWAVDTALLYAAPRQAELEQVIEQIVDGAREDAYGTMPSSVTGSERMGRVLAVNYDARNYFGGETIHLTKSATIQNSAYVSQDGRIISFKKGNNNPISRSFSDMSCGWHDHRIYR
jgi:mannosyltransferase OCH1-like enzyme/glycosyltransferase involved in cell wall biosynthesis